MPQLKRYKTIQLMLLMPSLVVIITACQSLNPLMSQPKTCLAVKPKLNLTTIKHNSSKKVSAVTLNLDDLGKLLVYIEALEHCAQQ